MIYLYLKDGKIEPFADKKVPQEKYGLKKPLAEITEEQYNESRGLFRIINKKLVIGPTEEEKNEELGQKKRQERDAALQATDKYLLVDFPISSADLEKVKAYRKTLRDLPTSKNWPAVEIPELPLKK